MTKTNEAQWLKLMEKAVDRLVKRPDLIGTPAADWVSAYEIQELLQLAGTSDQLGETSLAKRLREKAIDLIRKKAK